ncbi:SpoIIE family protein phosphatase [Streptomyces sp. TRM68367]|uniref:SpoIIE family protein phosphatase n=1 Tax=Streptomyces sp. TRM68367 TaxID=2758415 RepID=UPI0021D1DE9F|nr:SpoIIE family protein phosphatase [Streptomyces sp. TRM68367]
MGAIPTQRETVSRASEAPAQERARAHATLAGSSLAPGAARALVRAAIAEWAELGLPGTEHVTDRLADDASLVVSELVTNAVVHAGTDVELACWMEGDVEGTAALLVEVSDQHPSRAPRGSDAAEVPGEIPEYGRGLGLVAALAEAWGITYRTGTKTVWARLPAERCAATERIEAYTGEQELARGLTVAEILAPDPLWEEGGCGDGWGDLCGQGDQGVRRDWRDWPGRGDHDGRDGGVGGGRKWSGGGGGQESRERGAGPQWCGGDGREPSEGGDYREKPEGGQCPDGGDDRDWVGGHGERGGAEGHDDRSRDVGGGGRKWPDGGDDRGWAEGHGERGHAEGRGDRGWSDSHDDRGWSGGRDWRVWRDGRDRDGTWLGRGALSFLAEASDLLAGQLDENLVAALAGQLIVPRLADWCAVWLEDEGMGRGAWSGGSGAPGPRLARVWHGSENRIEELRGALEKEPPPHPPGSLGTGPIPYPWPGEVLNGGRGSGGAGVSGVGGASGAGGVDGACGAGGVGGGSAVLRASGAATVPGAPGADSASGGSGGAGAPGASGADGACGADGVSGPEDALGARGGDDSHDADGAQGSDRASGAYRADGTDHPSGADSARGVALAYRLVAGGRPLGTLVIGRAGIARFPDEITGLVEDLGRRVALAIGAARQYARQATISAVLQRGLLPGAVAEIPGVRSALVYEPCDKGGPSGDFYDLFPARDGRWCFALGDVQGKGPEAAVVIGLARPWLRLLAREGYGVAGVLDRLNQLLLDDATEAADAAARALVGPVGPGDGPQNRFLSLLYGELVPFDGGARCTLASAGHPLPLLLGPDGEVHTAAQPQTLLGVVEDVTYTSETFELRSGDTLLCVTDGVTERRCGSRQFDDGDGLAAALTGCAGMGAELIAERIKRLVHEFGARPPEDDLALLVLQAE